MGLFDNKKKPAQKSVENKKQPPKKSPPQKKGKQPVAKKTEKTNTPDNIHQNTANQYEAHIFRIGMTQDFSERLNGIVLLFSIALIILAVGMFRNATIKPENAYIPVDNTNRILVNEEAIFTSEKIVKFANDAILKTFSFNYLNFENKLYDIYNNYYTQEGARSLDSALSQRKFFEYMDNKNILIVESELKENALIYQQGTLEDGTRAWVVDTNIILTIVTNKQERKESYKYRLTIVEMPIDERRSQLGIAVIQQQER